VNIYLSLDFAKLMAECVSESLKAHSTCDAPMNKICFSGGSFQLTDDEKWVAVNIMIRAEIRIKMPKKMDFVMNDFI
jgi:hypothetical protein